MKKLLTWVGIYFVMVAVAFVVHGIYRVFAGKWLDSTFPMMFILPLSFMFMGWWMSRNARLSEPIGVPVLRELVIELGLKQVAIRIMEGSDHPKPICQPRWVSIPTRVLENYSEEALRWAVKSEIVAARKELKATLIWLFLPLVGVLISLAVLDRLQANPWWNAVPGVAVVVSIFWLSGFANRNLQACDKLFTQTESDRQAAKEALSFPYFDQLSRGPAKKWLYTAAGYRARAENLGITLERSYRVPGGGPIRVEGLEHRVPSQV